MTLLLVGLRGLVGYCTNFAVVMGSNPVQALFKNMVWFFFFQYFYFLIFLILNLQVTTILVILQIFVMHQSMLKGQFHGFVHVQALALTVLKFTDSY